MHLDGLPAVVSLFYVYFMYVSLWMMMMMMMMMCNDFYVHLKVD